MRLILENNSYSTDHVLPNNEKLANTCDVTVKNHVSQVIYFIYFHLLQKMVTGHGPETQLILI